MQASASVKVSLVRSCNREWSNVSSTHSIEEMRWKGYCSGQLASAQLWALRPFSSLKAMTVGGKAQHTLVSVIKAASG